MKTHVISLLLVPALLAPGLAFAGHDSSDAHVLATQRATDAKIKAKKELAKAQAEVVQKGQPIPAAPPEPAVKPARPAGAHP
jgi:hypothetical protein